MLSTPSWWCGWLRMAVIERKEAMPLAEMSMLHKELIQKLRKVGTAKTVHVWLSTFCLGYYERKLLQITSTYAIQSGVMHLVDWVLRLSVLVLCTVFLGTQCENRHGRLQLWSRVSILGENVFITSTYSWKILYMYMLWNWWNAHTLYFWQAGGVGNANVCN